MTPAGQMTTFPLPTPKSGAWGITAGPDGNLWFTEPYANQLGRITPSGQVTEFPVPPFYLSEKEEIIAGPDGNLWFSDFIGDRIGRITPTGQVKVFPLRHAQGITAGRDGNVWVALGGAIARITPAGQITRFLLPAPSYAVELTTGPDGTLWFTELDTNKIGRFTPGR